MTLKEKIDSAIREAMKAKDETTLLALRAVKSAILLAETEKGASESPRVLGEEKEIAILQKQIKQRKDSIEQFEKAGRTDLAQKEKAELVVIEKYLPQQLSAEELEKFLKEIIAQTGAASAKDFGKVMGTATQQLAGRADGKTVSETVKKLLGG